MIASPSCEGTQPPTPISTGLPPCLCAFQRPSWLKTFSWAFSRMEHVLTRITSASASSWVSSSPCDARSTSAILAESYSFIWQPWVLMKSLPLMGRGTVFRGGLPNRPVYAAVTLLATCPPWINDLREPGHARRPWHRGGPRAPSRHGPRRAARGKRRPCRPPFPEYPHGP